MENDFNGNLVNIWYIYVFVYYIKYMYILVIVNVLSFVKKIIFVIYKIDEY